MPKEIVRTQDETFNVEVGWTKDGDVQIGVVEPKYRSMWHVYGGSRKEVVGQQIRDIVLEAEKNGLNNESIASSVFFMMDDKCGRLASLWATLTRFEVNQIIRFLRRARDSAFGRDE